MARDLGEQNREDYARYKDDVKKEGKGFFPYAMLHDTVMACVVVLIIIGLAIVWYYDADGTEAGILGPWYEEPAEPGTTDFVPRPDWYFYFLFYLLRIFEWPETVFIATVGIPTIALVLLLGVPHLLGLRRRQPGRAGALGDRAGERRGVLRALPVQPRRVREHGDGLVRVPRAGESPVARRLPRCFRRPRRIRVAVGARLA